MEQVRLAIEIDPAYFFSYLWAGMIRCEEAVFDEAIEFLDKAARLSGGAPLVLGWLGMTLAKSGDTAAARNVLAQLHAMATQAYVLPTSFAWIHLGLGEIDQAYTWMERAIDDRDPIIIPIKTYPFLDPLRGDSRFHALLRKMNLEA
jgi:tetratricopeptide (TPR) repeat protein